MKRWEKTKKAAKQCKTCVLLDPLCIFCLISCMLKYSISVSQSDEKDTIHTQYLVFESLLSPKGADPFVLSASVLGK